MAGGIPTLTAPTLAHLELEEQGADIVDIGAESTSPGSQRISAEEEWRGRLAPVLKRLKDKLTIPISLDTYKAETAERALEYGFYFFNDPSGLTFDADLAKTVSNANAGADPEPHAWHAGDVGEAAAAAAGHDGVGGARSGGND